MDRIEKFKALSVMKADAAADIGLINQYSIKELAPEDVYCFSVVLCDNDVDRDVERFTDASLAALAPLFLGKTGISDHRWSAERQIARLYRVEVENEKGKNALGEPLRVLRGSAYLLNTETNQPIIEAIDGGIMKEVSISCSMGKCTCSICGEPLQLDWRTWHYKCENGHIKGEQYDKKLCCGNLEEPNDAFEFSFVAVPAQKHAGVTKGMKNMDDAFESLMAEDLSEQSDKVKALLPRLQMALSSADEREARAKILAENEKYIKKQKGSNNNG